MGKDEDFEPPSVSASLDPKQATIQSDQPLTIERPHVVSAVINVVYNDGTHYTFGATARDDQGLQIQIDNAITRYKPLRGQ